jgi:hypothetical protein
MKRVLFFLFLIPLFIYSQSNQSPCLGPLSSQSLSYEVGKIKWVYDYQAGIAHEYKTPELSESMYIHDATNNIYVQYEQTGNTREILLNPNDNQPFEPNEQDRLYETGEMQRHTKKDERTLFKWLPLKRTDTQTFSFESGQIVSEVFTTYKKRATWVMMLGSLFCICLGILFGGMIVFEGWDWYNLFIILFVFGVMNAFALMYGFVFLTSACVFGLAILVVNHGEEWFDFLWLQLGSLRRNIWDRFALLGEPHEDKEE